MKPAMRSTGKRGEELAAVYLQAQGYTILEKNYQLRDGEIDLIAKEGNCLCFVEVKMRTQDEFGDGSEAVDVRKQKRIIKAATYYLAYTKEPYTEARFDVLVIMKDPSAADMCYELFKDAFGAS